MNDAITINTRFNTDEIRQELRGSDDIRGNVHEHIMNLRDQGVREALKKLGWTPPGEESVQNQLYARIEELEQERGALAARVDAARPMIEAYRSHLGGALCSLDDEERGYAEEAESWLSSQPATSLARLKAQWQAEVLVEAGRYVRCEEDAALLRINAQEFRRQAEGGES